MRWVSLAVVFASTFAFAIKFSREGTKLIMSDVVCKDIQKNIDALSEWSLNLNPANKCTAEVEASKKKVGTCLADISSCVPEHVLKYHGTKSDKSGPNCWNLALVMSRVLPSMRYSDDKEMSFYLESPLCRPLKNDEQRKPGDVGVLRILSKYKEQFEHHAFIYVNESLVYAKNGPKKEAPFALQSLQGTYVNYDLTQKPECKKNEIDPNAGCRVGVGYFRCQSMDSYLKDNADITPKIKKMMRDFDNVEQCLDQHVIQGKPLGPDAKKSMMDVVAVLGKYYQQEVDKSPDLKHLNEKDRFLLGSLNLRITSIGEQLDETDKRTSRDFRNVVGNFFVLDANE